MTGRREQRKARRRLVLHLPPCAVERLASAARALKRSPESVAVMGLREWLAAFGSPPSSQSGGRTIKEGEP